MSRPEQFTHAELIDPGMMLARELGQLEERFENKTNQHTKLGRLLVVGLAAGSALGIGSQLVDTEAPEAHADYRCAEPDYVVSVSIYDANGNYVGNQDQGWCYGDKPTTPITTTPPNNGGGGNGGGNTGGGGTTTPVTIPDSDGDGLKNNVDNCDNVANPDQANFDGDGDGDVCDLDVDNDGILNETDVNSYSSDNDVDGLSDGYDPDSTNPDIDGDTFLDGDATELEDKAGDGTLDLLQSRIDIDGDGLSAETGDIDESNPCIPDATVDVCDADLDELTNAEEAKIGTDPNMKDTDGDGIDDGTDKEPLSDAGVEVDEKGVAIVATSSTSTTVERSPEATQTTEDKTVIVESSENSENNNSLLLPIGGGVGVVGLIAGLAFWGVRRNRQRPDEPEAEFGNTSPVAGN